MLIFGMAFQGGTAGGSSYPPIRFPQKEVICMPCFYSLSIYGIHLFPSATTSGGGPFHFFQYEVTVGIISVDGFESRFALACQPKGTCKEEIHRLFTAKHINPRTFSDCTDLDSTMYYRLQNEAEQPKLSTIVSLCVGFSLDTLTGYHLIALAGYTLLPRNTLHRIYAYFIENSQSLTISECNKFLEDMGFHKQGELLGSQQRK